MYYIGIDPDLHATSIAAIAPAPSGLNPAVVVGVWCIKHKGKTDRDAVLAMIEGLASFWSQDHLPRKAVAVAVESQEMAYTARSGKNPRSVAMLGPVSGGLLMASRFLWPEALLYLPAPQAWKGSVPKQVHQARIFGRLKWAYEATGTEETGYCYPTKYPGDLIVGVEEINKGDWRHVADAIGLALWCEEQHRKHKIRKQRLAALPKVAAA